MPLAEVCRNSDGAHVFTVAVDDGHGHQASDTITITVGPDRRRPGHQGRGGSPAVTAPGAARRPRQPLRSTPDALQQP
jgi:hypothetical protein